MKYIAFGAIPLGIVGLVAVAPSTIYSYYGTPKTDQCLAALGTFCIVVALASPIFSSVYTQKKKEYNRR